MRTAALFIAPLLLLLLIGCTKVESGNIVLVTYTGRYYNGTIFDSNDPAYQNVTGAPASRFTPMSVTVGAHQLIPGFENALIGMKKGETKQVLINAKDAYGSYDPEKLVGLPKRFSLPPTLVINRSMSVPKSELQQAVVVGKILSDENFNYNITGQNSTHVLLSVVNATRDPIVFGDFSWNSTLIATTKDTLTYKHLIKEGEVYPTPQGPYIAAWNGTAYNFETAFKVGEVYSTPGATARATRETSDTIYLDFNHPLAGETLNFTIKVEDISAK